MTKNANVLKQYMGTIKRACHDKCDFGLLIEHGQTIEILTVYQQIWTIFKLLALRKPCTIPGEMFNKS